MKLLHKTSKGKKEISKNSKSISKPSKKSKKLEEKEVGSILRLVQNGSEKNGASKPEKTKRKKVKFEVITPEKKIKSKKITAKADRAEKKDGKKVKTDIIATEIILKSKKIKSNNAKVKNDEIATEVEAKISKKVFKDSISKNKKVPTTVVVEKEEKPKRKVKKLKPIMPSSFVTEEIVSKALDALIKLSEVKRNTSKMFEEESQVFLQINTIKIQNKAGNLNFNLKHCTAPSTGEICLITPDLKRGRKPDHEPTIDHWEKLLREANVTNVKTILPMRQLRVEYDQFELKRRLMTQHDFIMVDTRVLTHVSHILGKMFFKKHNMLIPVRVQSKNLKGDIEKGLNTAILKLSQGPTSSLLVGNLGMKKKKIEENIMAVVEQLNSKFPGGERNIRSLEVKIPNSLALPLYWTLRSKKTVGIPRLPERIPKESRDVEGDLTTFLNTKVTVTPSGRVHVKKIPKTDDDHLMDSDDNVSVMEDEEDEEVVANEPEEE